jgi:cholesterol oxidase
VSARTVDVVVIGSGFGGSVAANRLAATGMEVLVLERGPWRDTLPIRSLDIESRAPLPYGWRAMTHLLRSVHLGPLDLTLNRAGLFEFFYTPGLDVLAASGVGGGSIAWGGLLAPPPDPAYWHGRHPALDPAAVEAYYDKVMADLGASDFHRGLSLPQSVWSHFPESPGSSCRSAERQPRMAHLFPGSADEAGRVVEYPGGLRREHSRFEGDGFLGSRGGAKASADFVYLAPVSGKGVTVRTFCEVTRIVRQDPAAGEGYELRFRNLATKTQETVRARRVVLAAGTMNTLRLLFASASDPAGLASMPSLGRRFGANSDLMGLWSRPDSRHSSFHAPAAMGAFAVEGHDSATLGMGSLGGFDTLPLPRWLKRRLSRNWMLYGFGADSGNASVRYDGNRLQLRYDQAQEPVVQEIRAAFRALERESGDRVRVLAKPLTVHQWGGACLGASESEGVVDHRGEVYGNPGLFIADGAALPAAPGGPPALPIAAWAHHVADTLAQRTTG